MSRAKIHDDAKQSERRIVGEQRRHRRRDLNRQGTISFRGEGGCVTIDCEVKDLSASGARLFVYGGSRIPAEFKLSVVGIYEQDCLVKWSEWRSTGELAVEFVSSSPH